MPSSAISLIQWGGPPPFPSRWLAPEEIESFPTEAEARAAADQLAAATGWDRVTVESLVGVVYQVIPQEKP